MISPRIDLGRLADSRQSAWLPPIQKLEPRNHKARIIGWVLFWPWSVFWTVLLNPVRYVIQSMCHEIHATFEGISEHEFDGIENDFAVLEDAEPIEQRVNQERNSSETTSPVLSQCSYSGPWVDDRSHRYLPPSMTRWTN